MLRELLSLDRSFLNKGEREKEEDRQRSPTREMVVRLDHDGAEKPGGQDWSASPGFRFRE